jgi:prepilin-type N-terminal cleavage/methylation domain-containing protein
MRRDTNRGFTLMELVVTLIVLALMASFAVPFMSNGARAYNSTAAGLQTLGELRYASERLVRELREIRNVGGSYDITSPLTAGTNRIRFRKSDGVRVTVDGTAPILSMSYDSVATETPFPLSDELSTISFNFYKSDGTPANSTSDVAFIDFEIVLNNGNNYAQHARVALRNQP